jgi:hypothetical protein
MKCKICDEETGIEIGGEPFCIFCESQSPRERNRIGNYPTCDECGEQHGESDCEEIPIGAMTEAEKQEYRLDQQDQAEEVAIVEQMERDGACLACGRKDGLHHAGCSQRHTDTIDITPGGCQTPEGNAKVNAAMKVFEESREEVARLATALLKNGTIVDMMRSVLVAQDEQEAIDYLDSLTDAVETRLKAEEAFLCAVAGR